MKLAKQPAGCMQPSSHIARSLGSLFSINHQPLGRSQRLDIAPVGACWHILQPI